MQAEPIGEIINSSSVWHGYVPCWVMEHAKEIGPSGIAVFTILCIHASRDRKCFPSLPTIAKETGCSTRDVSRIIKRLEKAKLIKILERGTGRGRSNLYEIIDRLQRVTGSHVLPLKHDRPMPTATLKGDRVAYQQHQEHRTGFNKEKTNDALDKLRASRKRKAPHD